MGIISSRALTLQGVKYLVPYADMFNCRSTDTYRKEAMGNHFLQHHLLQHDGMHVLSDQETVQNHQVFEDYGDNDNSIYVQYHGFVLEGNTFDCLSISLPKMKTAKHSSELKVNIMSILQLQDGPIACVYRDGR